MEAVALWIAANPEVSGILFGLIANTITKYINKFGGPEADLITLLYRGVVKASKKKTIPILILSMFVVFSGCTQFNKLIKDTGVSIETQEAVIDAIGYELGSKFKKQHPEYIGHANRVCDLILNSDDPEYIGTALRDALADLSKYIKDPEIRSVTERLAKKLKISVELDVNTLDMALAKVGVQAFKEGLE